VAGHDLAYTSVPRRSRTSYFHFRHCDRHVGVSEIGEEQMVHMSDFPKQHSTSKSDFASHGRQALQIHRLRWAFLCMHLMIAWVCHLLYAARYLKTLLQNMAVQSCRLCPIDLLCYWTRTARVADLEPKL